MQVKLVALFQNVLTIQVIVLCESENVTRMGTVSCVRESHAGQGRTRVTFLRAEDTGSFLYVSLWSSDMRLVACEAQANPLGIETYRTFCLRSAEDDRLPGRFDLDTILSPNAPCTKNTDAPRGHTGAGEGGGPRRKRSWILPGTLWCGTGSKAFGFDELGMFESADKCCREHDHCRHVIPAFTVNYGVFNPYFYTMSHCDCDQRFRQCLVDVNDTVSSMVLYSFFKIMKVPCFELKTQKRCTALYWWGMCKETQEAPYAIVKEQIYQNTSFTGKSGKKKRGKQTTNKVHQLTETKEIEPARKKPRPEGKCVSKDPPRGDTFFRMKTNSCRKSDRKQSTAAPKQQRPPLNTNIPSETNEPRSLSAQGTGLLTGRPFVKTPTTTTQTPALSYEGAHALQPIRATTTAPGLIGHGLSTEKTFQSQTKKSELTRMFSAVTPTAHSGFTATKPASFGDNVTTAETRTRDLERGTESPVHASSPAQEKNELTNPRDASAKQSRPLPDDKTGLCESLKHLDKCKFKIPPLKKRFGLKNADTKPVYHCACTKRLAWEIRSLKLSFVPSLLVGLVSENCFRLPKRKKCKNAESCSRGFSKASDLLQALKKIEQNDIAGVRNSDKLRKGRISVQLYKRCLRLRKEAMAQLT